MLEQQQQGIGPLIRAARKKAELTQKQLADLLNEESGWDTCTANDVYRWETGRRTPGGWMPYIVAVLDLNPKHETGTGSGTLPGREPVPLEPVGSPVDRRAFLSNTAALTATQFSGLITPTDPLPHPTKVAPDDVEQIHAAASALASWDYHFGGGGIVRQSAADQLAWAAALLHLPCPERLRSELFAATAWLGMAAGAICFDAYAHNDARRTFAFAATCAEEAGQWHLRAKTYSWRARQAIWLGDWDNGLAFAELGLTRSDRLTATEEAMLHSAMSRAYAKAGQVQETLRAVGAADEAFARSNAADDPPWMAYYDTAQHHGDTGHALYDLALAGHDPTEAERRLTLAVEVHTDEYARSRAMSRAKLASLAMRTGDPHQAAAIGIQALEEVGRMRSRRAEEAIREIAAASEPHARIRDVTELRARITEAVTGR